MAKVTFYEKPGCGNNSRQKALLAASGHDLDIRDLLSFPWTADSLRPFFGDRPVAEWFNRASPRVKAGDVLPETYSPEAAIAAMLADPLLIRRPLMEALGEKRCGFDAEQIRAWIGLSEDGKPAPETCARTDETRCAKA